MRFPPPVRFTAPLIALVFGLVATWFDYRLNLDLDLTRHLDELHELVDANGRRLARLSERLLAAGQREALFVEGKTAKEIAAQLNLSPKTVSVHRDHIKGKLEFATSTEMIRQAVRYVETEQISGAGE